MLESSNMKRDILLIRKPKGITSFDVIRQLRKRLGIRKMGHAGTLDPLAHGLMLIGIESGTKKLANLIGLSKKYIATIQLGKQTDTGDLEGKIIATKEVPFMTEEEIMKKLRAFEGRHMFPVPLYSAIKKDGKALYAYAREGEQIDVPVKEMHIIHASLISYSDTVLVVEWEVGSGTYIRTLAEEFAKELETVGMLLDLERTSIGEYLLTDAQDIDSVEKDEVREVE